MAPILTVIGATGTQGGAVVSTALATGTYKVRALTRNVNSEKAKALVSRGAEVVAADLNDENSLRQAFKGSTAIFAATDFFEPFFSKGPDVAFKVEVQQGKNIVNAATETEGLKHFIWSTLPSSTKISGGKYNVPHFEGKVEVDEYIKSKKELLAKTTFLWVTFFAVNFTWPIFTPTFIKSAGKYAQLQVVPPTVPIWTMGDTSKNLGPFVHAILEQPERTLNGAYVLAYVNKTTTGGLLESWSEATGKKTVYIQISSVKEYNDIWPSLGDEGGVMMKFWEEAGEKSWSGQELIYPQDLGIKVESLVGNVEAFKALDWSAI